MTNTKKILGKIAIVWTIAFNPGLWASVPPGTLQGTHDALKDVANYFPVTVLKRDHGNGPQFAILIGDQAYGVSADSVRNSLKKLLDTVQYRALGISQSDAFAQFQILGPESVVAQARASQVIPDSEHPGQFLTAMNMPIDNSFPDRTATNVAVVREGLYYGAVGYIGAVLGNKLLRYIRVGKWPIFLKSRNANMFELAVLYSLISQAEWFGGKQYANHSNEGWYQGVFHYYYGLNVAPLEQETKNVLKVLQAPNIPLLLVAVQASQVAPLAANLISEGGFQMVAQDALLENAKSVDGKPLF